MSDLSGELSAAARVVADATVPPPFATVERRARARRHRQVAAAAAGLAGVVAAAALAAPNGAARTAPPATEGTERPCLRVSERVAAEIRGGTNRPCVEVVNVAPENLARQETTRRCHDVPAPGSSGARTLTTGPAEGRTVHVLTWTGGDGTTCVGFRTDPPLSFTLSLDRDNDSGPAGALVETLAYDFLEDASGTQWHIYWGAVAPTVARVDLVVGGVRSSHPTLPGGDRAYVAFVQRVPADTRFEGPFGYDAEGRQVTLPRLND